MPLEDISSNISNISKGNLSYEFIKDDQSDEVHTLSSELNVTISSLKEYIFEITRVVTLIADKKLDITVDKEFAGDFDKIKEALIQIADTLNENFGEMHTQAQTVYEYSSELANTSENVAESATTQSACVLAASEEMEKLTSRMEQIAELANGIRKNAKDTNERLEDGSREMEELVSYMSEIANCYSEVAGLVNDINAIADQTNLLALNASIEAARAGEAGKGFAVVADEINTLSQSSANSSKRIGEAIARSLKAVEKGKEQVAKTETIIKDGMTLSVHNTTAVEEIATFVEEQKTSSVEISGNLQSISSMTENNAACAQENSAISTQLGECAKVLIDTISQFKLR